MDERLIGFVVVGAVVALLAASIARKSYAKHVRKRWPIVEALTTGLDPSIRVFTGPDAPTGFTTMYTHHLRYTYRGRPYELHLTNPVPHDSVVQLRINPARPSEAYFADDITQQMTYVAKTE